MKYTLSYKKLNSFFLLVMFFLISTKTFAAVNDVYFCETTNLVTIKDDKLETWKNQKFKFKRLKKKIIFPEAENYFSNVEILVIESLGELFTATEGLFNISYNEGRFNFTATNFKSITIATANCSFF